MQVDTEGGRIFRWSSQTDRPLVPIQVDDALDRDPEAGKPGLQVPWTAAGRRVNPDFATTSVQLGHERPGAMTEPFGIAPATPPGNVLLGRDGGIANQGIVKVKGNSHASTLFVIRLVF